MTDPSCPEATAALGAAEQPAEEITIGKVRTKLFRVRLAKALHEVDCGCDDFGDPTTDEDDRYIKAVDAALSMMKAQ